jgi:hypothetical protein
MIASGGKDKKAMHAFSNKGDRRSDQDGYRKPARRAEEVVF